MSSKMAGVCRALQVTSLVKTPSELKIHEVKAPTTVADDEILIDVESCGCNFFDTLIIQGKYQVKPQLPFVPGSEVAGVARAVGSKVTHIKAGDRVFGTMTYGAFSEVVKVQSNACFLIPPGMSFDEAASYGMVYGTSYLGIVIRGEVKKNDFVLIHAACGGVGVAAVQIAKAFGAIVIGTAGTALKCEVAKKAGCDLALNYSELSPTQIADAVMKFTKGHGADIIYDPVGGAVAEQSLKCIAWMGKLLVVGFACGKIPEYPANRILLKNISVVGVYFGSHLAKDPTFFAHILEKLNALFACGQIKPIIYPKIFALDEAGEALTIVGNRVSYGKVVVRPRAKASFISSKL